MKYTTKEVQQLLKISPETWKRRREEIFEYLKLFWNYKIETVGRTNNFIVIEEYDPVIPLPRKNKTQEISQFYANETDHILKYKNRNTAANLAREITTYNNKYNHAEGTVENYIRPYLKANYTVGEKTWCSINYDNFTYDEITQEQLKYLNQQFTNYLSSTRIANIMSDQESGYITKDEAYEKIKGRYDEAINAFKQRFGFRPYKAGELLKNAWVIPEEPMEKEDE